MSSILIINSSFRPKSNSSLLSARVAAGATAKGHTVQTIDIGRLRIDPCWGCEKCWLPNADFCVNKKDDMHQFYPAVRDADALVYVSPVYWFNLGGQIKQFIDRCFAVATSPNYEGPSRFAGKKIGAVLVYGDSDPFNSGCVNALRSLQDICTYAGAQWMGALYGSALGQGEIASNAELMERAREYGALF